MIKGEGNNLGRAEDMGVINREKEKTRKQNLKNQHKACK
jgi:hypothetical protein